MWPLKERNATIEVRGEAINAFNRAMFANPNTDQFNTAFGQISATANYARQIQAVVRLNFEKNRFWDTLQSDAQD